MSYLVRGDPAPNRPEGVIEPDPSLPRLCVIGAGSCGIAAAKVLYEARVPFDCFEAGPVVGGLWVFENPNGRSGCYSTLEMNTSGPRMSYSDFPLGSDDYPPWSDVRDYFDRYVDHFGIRDTITFETAVEHVTRDDDGRWEVELSTGETRAYDAIVVANGHHWDPRWPEPPFPGEFNGVEMHSHDYRRPEQLAGKRVIVVGGGNSGVDIARDAADFADEAYLSLRRGIHVIRKRIGRKRKPVDQLLAPPWLPWPLKQKGFEVLRWRSGDVSDLGLPVPDHKVGHAHPTVSDQIRDRLEAGTVTPKPNIRELRGDRVLFDDLSEVEADLIIYCTGYKVSFPFFDPDFISAPGNDLPLYRRTFHPEIEGVYFLGLAQPLGAIMPMAEQQSKWGAALLRGDYVLPPGAEMRADMARERAAQAERFYVSKRHTMEVDFDEWMRDAQREMSRGAQRAADGCGPAAVPSRAASA
ncbi:MAG TPA: NAD(P)-binding domain-containing protein [Solirubrobacterales bacterium]|nr:NAD(P)-binding domain-containing protein [Solirubrobacterales bacterium]